MQIFNPKTGEFQEAKKEYSFVFNPNEGKKTAADFPDLPVPLADTSQDPSFSDLPVPRMGQLAPETPANQPEEEIQGQGNNLFTGGADTPENRAARAKAVAGGSSFMGLPTQQSTVNGEKRNYLVPQTGRSILANPTAGFAGAVGTIVETVGNLMGNQPGTADRVLLGSGTEATKSLLSFGEWLLDKTPGVNMATDPDYNWINENFATMPAANEFEKVAQEVGSIVIGATAGGMIVDKLMKATKLGETSANLIVQFWDKAKAIDPQNAPKKLELFIRYLLVDTVGASAGATITTPQGTEPIPFLGGQLPEDMPGLTPEETKRLGHFVDNAAFSAGLYGLWKLGSKGAGAVKDRFFGGLKDRATTVAVADQMLMAIDPGVTDDIPLEELANRATILGEIMQKHSSFQTALSDQPLPSDAATAMIAGAREYVDRAYAFRKAAMTPDEYSKMVDQYATELVGNVIAIKQGMRGNEAIRRSEANFQEAAKNVFDQTADTFATRSEGNLAGQQLGQPIADQLNSARQTMDNAQSQAITTREAAMEEANKTELISLLRKARGENVLGDARQTDAVKQQMDESLYNGWVKAKQGVDDAFAAIPNEQIDVKNIAEAIAQAGDKDNLLRIMRVKADTLPVSPLPEPLKEGDDPMQDLIDDLIAGGITDTRTLISEVRPNLVSMRDDYLTGDKKNNLAAKQVDTIIKAIDDEIGKSTNPAVMEAMSRYKKFADTYLQTPELRAFDLAARGVVDVGEGMLKGQSDMYSAARNAYEQAMGQGRTSEGLTRYLNAVQAGSTEPVGPTVSKAIVGDAMSLLASNTANLGTVTPEQLVSGLRPYLNQIRTADPAMYTQIEEVFDLLRNNRDSLTAAEDAATLAQTAYTKLSESAKREAAYTFLDTASGTKIEPLMDNGRAWARIFSAQNAPETVGRLLQQASDEGNDLAVDGIKAEFTRWLSDNIFTTRPTGVSVSEEGASFARESSNASLRSILEGNQSNVLTTMGEVFKDQPQTAEAIYELMTRMHNQVNARAAKANPFGSDTAQNQALQRNINTMITLTFGVLNRTAARARAISGALTAGQDEVQRKAIDALAGQMLADPTFFSQALKAVAADASGETFQSFMRRAMAVSSKEMTRGVMGAAKPEDQQTEEVFR